MDPVPGTRCSVPELPPRSTRVLRDLHLRSLRSVHGVPCPSLRPLSSSESVGLDGRRFVVGRRSLFRGDRFGTQRPSRPLPSLLLPVSPVFRGLPRRPTTRVSTRRKEGVGGQVWRRGTCGLTQGRPHVSTGAQPDVVSVDTEDRRKTGTWSRTRDHLNPLTPTPTFLIV